MRRASIIAVSGVFCSALAVGCGTHAVVTTAAESSTTVASAPTAEAECAKLTFDEHTTSTDSIEPVVPLESIDQSQRSSITRLDSMLVRVDSVVGDWVTGHIEKVLFDYSVSVKATAAPLEIGETVATCNKTRRGANTLVVGDLALFVGAPTGTKGSRTVTGEDVRVPFPAVTDNSVDLGGGDVVSLKALDSLAGSLYRPLPTATAPLAVTARSAGGSVAVHVAGPPTTGVMVLACDHGKVVVGMQAAAAFTFCEPPGPAVTQQKAPTFDTASMGYVVGDGGLDLTVAMPAAPEHAAGPVDFVAVGNADGTKQVLGVGTLQR